MLDLPTYIHANKASQTDNRFVVTIKRIVGFKTTNFSFATDSLDEALFYRNFVLDLIGRKRPDSLEPSLQYKGPACPSLYAPIPVRCSTQEDF